MNKYEKIPDAIIDLHRYTTAEAHAVLDDVFSDGTLSHVRIITGKGLHGGNGPVLKTYVKKYLTDHNLRFNQSKIQDGGEGSLEVFV